VIIGAAAELELELDPPPVLAPAAPAAPDDGDDEVFVVFSIDDFNPDVDVDFVSVMVPAEFVARGPAVSVTSCPPPRAAPPSVKLVKLPKSCCSTYNFSRS
jgi:hypothetical protein